MAACTSLQRTSGEFMGQSFDGTGYQCLTIAQKNAGDQMKISLPQCTGKDHGWYVLDMIR